MADLQDELVGLRAQVAALTARLYRVEQRLGLESESPREAPVVKHEAAKAPYPLAPPPSTPAKPSEPLPTFLAGPLSSSAAVRAEEDELEGQIGKLWLNRIGIVAILVGVSYFIKYAFDNGWIGPAGRVALGLLAGIALILWSERFRSRGHAPFSYSLKAVGIGTLYLSLWGAFQVYHLVPSAAAFVAMILVTASTVTLALTQDAEILAAFAMIGGFSTPLLLSTGENHEVVLFSYVCLLDLAMLAVVRVKPWRRLLVGSFTGTAILYGGWFFEYYTKEQRGVTTLFTLIFAAIFAAIPLLTPLTRSRWHAGFSITLTFLPLVNAGAAFLCLHAMYEDETLTWFALALAGAYLVLSSQFKRRLGSDPDVVKTINLLHVAIAVAFITIAIPLKLNSHWITLGWLVESAVLLYISVRTQTNFLRYFAAVTLSLGIIRLLIWDNFSVETLIFNARFATYLVAIAILGGIVAAASRSASERERPAVRLASILLNLLALIALTLEASDYFRRQATELYQMHDRAAGAFHQINLARNFSYSLIWLAYGAGLMMFGFRKRSAFVRWQALVLIAFTIGKVFLFDVSELQQGYRILSFIALGGVLMGISYVYHRDWLKLGASVEAKSSETPFA
ncbi:MAG: hypothetical protein DMG64_11760 [Acidobacteria bacterium]|nr:MAG: hypothetical protein DMG64_11760 [Acidobacteriota bacterium]PYY24172.1 MAG: hypothetical protein DMG62_03970 [Acidobacteriota bacterium]